jgi:tRNA(fMet)-specific endonuclease VapC
MSLFLLDTDTLTLLQQGHPIVSRNASVRPDTDIQISVLSLQEQMKGWLGRFGQLTSAKQTADWYDRFIVRLFPIWRRYPLLTFPEPAIRRFEQLRKLRLNVGLMDLRIAASAVEYGLTVVTRNRRDFGRIAGLSVVDWSV